MLHYHGESNENSRQLKRESGSSRAIKINKKSYKFVVRCNLPQKLQRPSALAVSLKVKRKTETEGEHLVPRFHVL